MPSFMDLVLLVQRHSVIVMTLVFCLIVLWAYWPSNKKSIEEHGRIPLNDEP